MTKETTTDRAALQRAATLVRPALADKAYIPALTHILFAAGWATAYNDRMAIAVRCAAPLERLVPGMLLAQGLASFGGKDVLFQQDADGSLMVRSGRAKVKLPTLPADTFPFRWPANPNTTLPVEADMVKAVERCLVSVNNDTSHPAQMGVTMDADDAGRAVFYSTDNSTVSRAQCKTKVKLPGDVPVILPKFFCEQLVALDRAFQEAAPSMTLGDGYIEVSWSTKERTEARLFSRVPVDLEPMDFPRIMKKHVGDLGDLKKRAAVIPDELDTALQRALLVLGGEVGKKTMAEVDGGTLRLRSSSDLGDADDTMKLDVADVGPVPMDAALVNRGLKTSATLIGITDVVTILASSADGEFIHLVAHLREG